MTETAERLAEIRARVEALPPGPWDARSDGLTVRDANGFKIAVTFIGDGEEDWDRAVVVQGFIAEAREDIPWLLMQLYEARRLREDALAQRNQYGKELTKARIEIERLKSDLQNQIVPVEGTPLQRAAARARNMLRVVFPGTVEYARDVLNEALLGDQQESEN